MDKIIMDVQDKMKVHFGLQEQSTLNSSSRHSESIRCYVPVFGPIGPCVVSESNREAYRGLSLLGKVNRF
uniref:Uncharacterized protein n=1 Tax=Oryza sativa subsp. japonica TaxID=39947 RepID=Q6ZG15_ORYSJ|nr:hypothetical protein [Oryza sativa Japonica Group]